MHVCKCRIYMENDIFLKQQNVNSAYFFVLINLLKCAEHKLLNHSIRVCYLYANHWAGVLSGFQNNTGIHYLVVHQN